MINQSRLVQTFFQLVQIDSPSGHEQAIGDFMANRLKELGCQVSIDKAGNVLATYQPDSLGAIHELPLLISGHLDTVEPGRGIKPFNNSGTLRSQGDTILGADNKVNLAAILEVLTILNSPRFAKEGARGSSSLEILLSTAEETGLIGIQQFDFNQLKAKHGICFDKAAPLGVIVKAAPWIREYQATITGQAAHIAAYELATNALLAAAQGLVKLPLGIHDNGARINVGDFHSGHVANSVPGEAKFKISNRAFSAAHIAANEQTILQTFTQAAEAVGTSYQQTVMSDYTGYVYHPQSDLLQWVNRCLETNNLQPQFIESGGGSDANILIQHGIQVVNLADGSKHAHSNQESITVENLVSLARLMLTMATTKFES